MIISGSDDSEVKLWDTSRQELTSTLFGVEGTVNAVRFHPDGACAAASSTDANIRIWDIRSQRLIQFYDGHSNSVTSIAFHPSGNYLLSSSLDSTLKIWDLRQGHIIYTLHGHEGGSTAVAFSKDGGQFVSGGIDGKIIAWKTNIMASTPETSSQANSKAKSLNTTNKLRKSQSLTGTIKSEKTEEAKLSEDLAEPLNKIVSQLNVITKAIVSLDQRVNKFEDHIKRISDRVGVASNVEPSAPLEEI